MKNRIPIYGKVNTTNLEFFAVKKLNKHIEREFDERIYMVFQV